MKLKDDYVKAILYAYPSLGAIGEAVGVSADNKALLSYRDPHSAQSIAEEILKEIAARRAIMELSSLVDDMLKLCTEEELFLFEYKYFRRKKVLAGRFAAFSLACSERSYFRKQNRLLRKTADYFAENGWSQEKFLRETNGLFSRVVSAIGGGRECAVHAQRRKRGLRYSSD